MNFNLIPDELVNKFQQADDEAAIIDILTMDRTQTKTIVECNPDTAQLDLYCVIKNDDIEKLLKFVNNTTDSNISKNRLASEEDYKLVLRVYDDSTEYIDFGILTCKASDPDTVSDDTTGYELNIIIHTFDKERIEFFCLEEAEYIQIYNHSEAYIKVDCSKEAELADYKF